MEEALKHAAALYREIKARGLDLLDENEGAITRCLLRWLAV